MTDAPEGVDKPIVASLVALVMAGGRGTRFWPLSTSERPKQFLKLLGDRTMLQQTVDRLTGLVPPERILVLTNQSYIPLVREQLPELPAENIVGEPVARDTAAAIALGAVLCSSRFGDSLMVVLPADHFVVPTDVFQRTLLSAAKQAAGEDCLYTIGIPPTYPATGYGYLEAGDSVFKDGIMEHYRLQRFKEKPDLDLAKEYLQSGRYYWNSGMFVWRTETILGQFREHLPGHADRLLPLTEHVGSPDFTRRLEKALQPLPSISIDYGVMEKAQDVRMVRALFQWSDVGGWVSLASYLPEDAAGNRFKGLLHSLDAGENVVYCQDEDEQVALLGVSGLIVVRVGQKTLVAHKSKAEEIKALLKAIQGADKTTGNIGSA